MTRLQTEMANKPPLVVILGYNAIGKSQLGLNLARILNGEIISADSRQVYRHLDLGTAKVSAMERATIPHHLIDVADPGSDFSLAQYQEMAFGAIDMIGVKQRIPILVGGTGLYISSVVDNYVIPDCPPNYELRQRLEQQPMEALLEILQFQDPISAKDPNLVRNRRRLVRALEVAITLNEPFSRLRRKGEAKHNVLQVGLTMPFDKLYARIDARVDLRFELGMLQEVQQLLEMGVTHEWLVKMGLEYRHISRFFRGEVGTFATMAQELKYAIHRFTRRQRTWFRKDTRIRWYEVDSSLEERVLSDVSEFLSASDS